MLSGTVDQIIVFIKPKESSGGGGGGGGGGGSKCAAVILYLLQIETNSHLLLIRFNPLCTAAQLDSRLRAASLCLL